MKATVIAAILAFTTSAVAAPLESRQIISNCATSEQGLCNAINDCASSSNQDACVNVVKAINGWDSSVNTVNNFLNEANELTNPTLTSEEGRALLAANQEPGFLGTLQSTSGLSQAGQAAASRLGTNFPQIPQTLANLENGIGSVQDGVSTINNIRCGSVLEDIGTLWIEAAAAAGAPAPGRPLGPLACPKPGGNSGDGYFGEGL